MTYERLRLEFTRQSFREEMKEKLGCVCVNCGSNENIEYHHIVPLKNGGTNNLSNIVPMCRTCHFKSHDKKLFKNIKGGRPKAIEFEEAEPILHRYYALEIGTKETKELLGISIKNKTTLTTLRNQYEKKYNIEKFRNNVDLLNAQNKRVKKISITLQDALPHLKRFYKNEISEIECKKLLGLSAENKLQWGRLLKKI